MIEKLKFVGWVLLLGGASCIILGLGLYLVVSAIWNWGE